MARRLFPRIKRFFQGAEDVRPRLRELDAMKQHIFGSGRFLGH